MRILITTSPTFKESYKESTVLKNQQYISKGQVRSRGSTKTFIHTGYTCKGYNNYPELRNKD